VHHKSRSQEIRRLILLIPWVGYHLTVHPSVPGLTRGNEYAWPSRHAIEGDTTPGLRLWRCTLATFSVVSCNALCLVEPRVSQGPGGPRPHEPHQLTGHGHDHLVGMCPSGHQGGGKALAPSHVAFQLMPGSLGLLFQSALEMPADVGGVAVRPGAFHESADAHAYGRLW